MSYKVALGALCAALLAGCAPAALAGPLEQAQAQIEAGDYAAALQFAGPLARHDRAAGEIVGAARLARAQQLIAAAPGDLAALRRALDEASLGLIDAPADSAGRQELEQFQDEILALLELRQLAAQLDNPDLSPGDRLALAASLAERAETARAVVPGAAEIIGAAWLDAGLATEGAAVALEEPEARTLALHLAGERCGRAAEQLPDNTDHAAQARACLDRLASGVAANLAPEPEPEPAGQAPVAAAPRPAPTSRPAPPAHPRPAPTNQPAPRFSVAQRRSFDSSGNSGQYASCIDVQVLGRSGPVGGAVIGINNGDHSYQNQTDAGGYTGRCGLGASSWSVVLFWAPPGGEVQGAATTVYLSGAPDQRAAVVFQER